MTVPSTAQSAGPFTGNGSTALVIPFSFCIFEAADLLVTVENTSTGVYSTLVLGTDYTVAMNGNQTNTPGGSVTMLWVATTSQIVFITTNIAYNQSLVLTSAGGIQITNALDWLCMQIKQVATGLASVLTLPLGVSGTLPNPQAGSMLGWNTSGTALINIPLTSYAPSSMDSGSVIFKAFSYVRSVYAALMEMPLSLANWGATLTATDNSTALQAALDSGLNFFVPNGDWKIQATSYARYSGATMTMYVGAHLVKNGGAFDALVITGSNWEFIGVRVNCNSAGGSGIGVKGSNNFLDHCEVYGSASVSNAHGIYKDGTATTCIFNRIVNAWIHQVGGVGVASNSAPDNETIGCVIYQTGLEGITDDLPSYRTMTCNNIIKEACQVGGVGGMGIDQASNGTFTGNVINATGNNLPAMVMQNNVGSTNFCTATSNTMINNPGGGMLLRANSVGGTVTAAASLVVGQIYQINFVGSTNFIACGAKANQVGIVFQCTAVGTGTGTAMTTFTCNDNALVGNVFQNNGMTLTAGSFVVGNVYEIVSIGTTDFTAIGAPVNQVGQAFKATGVGSGSGTAKTGDIMIDSCCFNNTVSANGANATIIDANAGGLNVKSAIPSAFRAYKNTAVTNVTGDGTAYTVPFDTANFNLSQSFNASTGIFTAPATGVYHFSAGVLVSGAVAATSGLLQLVQSGSGSQTTQGNMEPTTSANTAYFGSLTDTIALQKGDQVKVIVTISGTTKTWGIGSSASQSWFSGNLVA